MNDPIGKQALEVMSQAQWYNLWTYNLLKPHIKGRVLEIGSGIGNFTSILARDAQQVVATDIRPEYIKQLRKLKSKKIMVISGNIETNKFSAKIGKFDAIVCLNVLEHIDKDFLALENMRKKLKAGGRLLLLVPAHMFFYGSLDVNLGHFRRYSKTQIKKKLKKAGFEVNSLRYLNPISGLGWFFNSRVLKKRSVSLSNIKLFSFVVKPLIFLEEYFEPPFGLSVLCIAEK